MSRTLCCLSPKDNPIKVRNLIIDYLTRSHSHPHTHTHTHTHIHTHRHTYIHTCSSRNAHTGVQCTCLCTETHMNTRIYGNWDTKLILAHVETFYHTQTHKDMNTHTRNKHWLHPVALSMCISVTLQSALLTSPVCF